MRRSSKTYLQSSHRSFGKLSTIIYKSSETVFRQKHWHFHNYYNGKAYTLMRKPLGSERHYHGANGDDEVQSCYLQAGRLSQVEPSVGASLQSWWSQRYCSRLLQVAQVRHLQSILRFHLLAWRWWGTSLETRLHTCMVFIFMIHLTGTSRYRVGISI